MTTNSDHHEDLDMNDPSVIRTAVESLCESVDEITNSLADIFTALKEIKARLSKCEDKINSQISNSTASHSTTNNSIAPRSTTLRSMLHAKPASPYPHQSNITNREFADNLNNDINDDLDNDTDANLVADINETRRQFFNIDLENTDVELLNHIDERRRALNQ